MEVTEYTKKEWLKKGKKLFGDDMLKWKFVCPSCGNVQSAMDFKRYKNKGATPSDTYFKCIGRFRKKCHKFLDGGNKKPCDYTSGGLLCISPISVTDEQGEVHSAFEFFEPVKESV